MSISSYDENAQWAIVDKFSMDVIHNAAIDIIRRSTAKKRSGDFVEYDIDLIGESEKYPSEYAIFDGDGHCCVIKTEWLYEAMLCLEKSQKKIIILKYWYGLLQKEIAEILCISEKTVTNRKNKAFEHIRNYRRRMLESDIRGP